MTRLELFLPASGVIGVLIAGCVYDAGERCGPHQEMLADDVCSCRVGYQATNSGCVALTCGAHEAKADHACVCAEGYARVSAEEPCTLVPGELGADCEPETNPCSSAKYPECHTLEAGGGYCTRSGCESNDDCDGGYACEGQGAESFCRRPPTGYGDACQTSEDCAGEATYCQTLQAPHVCLQACQPDAPSCFSGYECCDLSGFKKDAIFCVPTGACPVN